MRYQANGAKPERRTIAQERLDDQRRRDERHHEADARSPAPRADAELVPHFEQIVRERRRHRRHREEERELGGGRPIEAASASPPTIVAARARHAGNQRQRLARRRSPSARPTGSAVDVEHVGARPQPLDDQHDDAADDERRAR